MQDLNLKAPAEFEAETAEALKKKVFLIIICDIIIFFPFSSLPLILASGAGFNMGGIFGAVIASSAVFLLLGAVDGYIMYRLIKKEGAKQGRILKWVSSMNTAEQKEAVNTLKNAREFDTFCLFPDYVYLPSSNRLIGYEEIKDMDTVYKFGRLFMRFTLADGRPSVCEIKRSKEFMGHSEGFISQINLFKKEKLERINSK